MRDEGLARGATPLDRLGGACREALIDLLSSRFCDVPEAHDGPTKFVLRLHLSLWGSR